MAESSEESKSAVAVQFLQAFLLDRANGRERDVAAYQELFPSHRELIAAEYAALLCVEPEGGLEFSGEGSRYRDAREIGRGGMGRVLRCYDPSLGRDVAMKQLSAERARAPEAGTLRRFLHEARVTAQLRHPGIIGVYEIGVSADGCPYYTMPLVTGESFQLVIASLHGDESGPWTLVRSLGVLVRVAEAIAHAHERGVIHRDLKPANIMVGSNGEVVVVDWGVARSLSPEAGEDSVPLDAGDAIDAMASWPHTVDGDVMGTPAYMAPEQARGNMAAVDRRSDVYSLGAVLYHLLSGRAPFTDSGSTPSTRETLARVLQGDPKSLHTMVASAPAELVSICERAMAREPDHRYASAGDMVADLNAFLENRVVRAHPQGAFAQLRKWTKRNRLAAGALLFATLALLAGLVTSLVFMVRSERNLELADRNFLLAVRAGDDLIGRVGFAELSMAAGCDPVRLKLAVKAIRYYEQIASVRPGKEANTGLALTNLRLGLLHKLSRRFDEAEKWLTRAREMLQQLGGMQGERVNVLRMMFAENQLLDLEAARGGDTLEAMREQARLIRAIRAEHPEEVPPLNLLLTVLSSMESQLKRRKMFDEWQLVNDERLAAVDVCSARRPGELVTFLQVERAHQSRAQFQQASGKLDEAVASYRKTLKTIDAGLEKYVGHRDLRFDRCRALNVIGTLLMQQKKPKEAFEIFGRAVAAARTLTAGYPDFVQHHGELAGGLSNLAVCLARRGKAVEAELHFLEARSHAQSGLALQRYQQCEIYYGTIAREWCRLLVRAGRYEECPKILKQLQADVVEEPRVVLVAFANCANYAREQGKDLPTAVRKELDDGVIELLQICEEKGLLAAWLFENPMFKIVHRHPGYVELAAARARRRATKR